jgi:hypothetical protein
MALVILGGEAENHEKSFNKGSRPQCSNKRLSEFEVYPVTSQNSYLWA